MTPDDDDHLLTPRDLARMLGKSTSTLGTWRHDGVGPPWIKRHGRVYYWHSKVLAWLHTDSPESPATPLQLEPAAAEQRWAAPVAVANHDHVDRPTMGPDGELIYPDPDNPEPDGWEPDPDDPEVFYPPESEE